MFRYYSKLVKKNPISNGSNFRCFVSITFNDIPSFFCKWWVWIIRNVYNLNDSKRNLHRHSYTCITKAHYTVPKPVYRKTLLLHEIYANRKTIFYKYDTCICAQFVTLITKLHINKATMNTQSKVFNLRGKKNNIWPIFCFRLKASCIYNCQSWKISLCLHVINLFIIYKASIRGTFVQKLPNATLITR